MDTVDPESPVPTECVLQSDPSVHVANIELGVTFYLDDAAYWAERGAAQALELFTQLAPRDHLLWYTTSRLDHAKRVREATLHEVLDAFSVHWLGKVRHGFELVLADDVGSEAVGFRYVEVDERRVDRTAVLELTIPAHFDPALLQRMADAVFELGPTWCGIGGYALRYNVAYRSAAFRAAHAWAKRYLGMDIQDRDRMPWLVKGHLPGVSWLNYLGSSWLQRAGLDAAALDALQLSDAVARTSTARGVCLVAGAAPTLADLNRFERPTTYQALARALASHFVREPPALYGDFLRDGDAAAWFRRFVEPEGWA